MTIVPKEYLNLSKIILRSVEDGYGRGIIEYLGAYDMDSYNAENMTINGVPLRDLRNDMVPWEVKTRAVFPPKEVFGEEQREIIDRVMAKKEIEVDSLKRMLKEYGMDVGVANDGNLEVNESQESVKIKSDKILDKAGIINSNNRKIKIKKKEA